MKNLLFVLLLLLPFTGAVSQECKAYIPYDEGTKSELTNYDKKGKVTGIVNQEITKVEHNGNSTLFSVHQVFNDPKSKEEPFETNMTFKCVDGVFYIDMSGYLDKNQMNAYGDMEIKVSMDEIDIPSSYKVGEKLKDGSVNMEIVGGPVPLKMSVKVVNRLVSGEEQLTTPAGTFDCVKISQDIVTKSIMTMKINSVEWYAEGVGIVKSETYRKGKLMGYSELTKFEKP